MVEGLVDILLDTVTEGTGDKPVKANCDAPEGDMVEQEASTLADTVTVNDVVVFETHQLARWWRLIEFLWLKDKQR